jgi:hypothetical protein
LAATPLGPIDRWPAEPADGGPDHAPRTGARESHLDAVLHEGRIDAFLLAWLRRQRETTEPQQ